MSLQNDLAAKYWSSGESLKASQLLYGEVPAADRVSWSFALLELSVRWLNGERMHSNLLDLRDSPSRWVRARRLFEKIRSRTLRLEGRKSLDDASRALLNVCYLSENVAKVVYNSTNPIDEFDEDAGSWIAHCLWHCTQCCPSPNFKQEAEVLLFGRTLDTIGTVQTSDQE